MRRLAILIIAISISLISCEVREIRNANGHLEREYANREFEDVHRNKGPIRRVSIGDSYYSLGNPEWSRRQEKSYAYSRQYAIDHGYDPDWYADKNSIHPGDAW
jgi:hypothetical protein